MLYKNIAEYTATGVYPMHMPGHKRNSKLLPNGLPYEIDITEIHGFDDLHVPQGILLETVTLASELYGSKKAFPLVNGSTVGILAAIGAHARRGDKILIAGDCHRSVHNAAELFGLSTVGIMPETDADSGVYCSIDPGTVAKSLEKHPEIRLAVVTSPSYEGVISDIAAIAESVHKHDIPLIVDAAHGAHLGLSDWLPGRIVGAGADVVIMSLHKTLPALTQCSLLHICSSRADAGEVARLLSVLQTSSPSYVLMASIDQCIRILASDREELFKEYSQNLGRFSEGIMPLKRLSVLCHGSDVMHPGFFAFDPCKLVIVTKNTAISGLMLTDILRDQYKIELEKACVDYAIALTSICDSAEGFNRLADALCAIDNGF